MGCRITTTVADTNGLVLLDPPAADQRSEDLQWQIKN
jgi:hypothetical protein